MAIMYVSNQIIGRGKGRSAVAAAAYRRGAHMVDERQGRSCNYQKKENVSYSEISIPKDSPVWVEQLLETGIGPNNQHSASEALWNLVESFEKRSDAQLAREMLLALPAELSLEQNIELVREYTRDVLCKDGLIVDWSIHNEEGNPHVHLMMPTRLAGEDGFGLKRKPLVNENGEIVRRKNGPKKGQPFYKLVIGEKEDLARWKQGWAEIQNLHLERAGHSIRVDHRSYAEQGLTLQGGNHLGPAASAIKQREGSSYQFQVQVERLEFNAKQVLNNPENIVRKVSNTRAIFSENDLVREAGKYLDSYEDIEIFRARVMTSSSLVKLVDDGLSENTGRVVSAARYTTHEVLDVEMDLVSRARVMAQSESHGIAIRTGKSTLREFDFLGDDQKVSVEHILIDKQLACVVGYAGTGKTTMVEAAKNAWEREGYRVQGTALSGIAAEGLGEGANITSRTIASWEYSWSNGQNLLTKNDVLVVDEAGMIGSRQMRDLIKRVKDADAKLVLIGDPEQLQPIEAGAAFRAVVEQTGCSTISTVRRQQEEWMRDASKDFAEHRTAFAMEAYSEHGHLHHHQTAHEAKEALVKDWIYANEHPGSQIILAHRRVDTAELNFLVRNELLAEGKLMPGERMQTVGGEREFSVGERIIFKNNDRTLGVKNGMLGTVTKLDQGGLSIRLDQGRELQLRLSEYNHIDYGYAATIHKSQGVTVDKTFVYGSKTMDRHLTYVAMTRHRHQVDFYSSKQEFGDQGLIPQVLAKARMQQSAINFLENREYAPQLDKIASTQVFLERQKKKLIDLSARFERVVAKVLPRRTEKKVLPAVTHSDRVKQPDFSSSISKVTVAIDSKSQRFNYSQISSKDTDGLKASLLNKDVVSKAIQQDVSVIRAHTSLVRAAGYVSPQFQAEIKNIPVEQLSTLDMSTVLRKPKLNVRDHELMSRAAATLDGTLSKAQSRHLASVNTTIDTLVKPLPRLSNKAQAFIVDCEKLKDEAKLKSLYQTLGPKASDVRSEIQTYMKALAVRVEATQNAAVAPGLAVKLLPIKPATLGAATQKASATIRLGVSKSLRRGIDLTR